METSEFHFQGDPLSKILIFLLAVDNRKLSQTSKNMRLRVIYWKQLKYKFNFEGVKKFMSDKKFRSELKAELLSAILYDNKKVIDVSPLSSIQEVELRNLSNVTDVSALSTVHKLYLNCLDRVTDVSALGSVHTLSIHWLDGVTDVSALASVQTLTL